jgi:glycosyltransferase involved in cell wall biosynthesis
MGGADRDWLNLANAWDAGDVRLTWAGCYGCDYLRPYATSGAVDRFLDHGAPPFNYLIQENMLLRRSPWLWTKIIADHLLRLWKPWRRTLALLADTPVDVVVSNTAAVTVGALVAWSRRLPHVWCVKEWLDPKRLACRRWARWIARQSDAVVVPSRAVARAFPGPVCVFPDGNDVDRIRHSARFDCRAEVLKRLDLPAGRPVVAHVAALLRWKGQHVTAEAFARMAAAAPGAEPAASLLFLGNGAPDYRAHLEDRLSGLPTAWRQAVRFVHFHPDDFSYLAAADVVVHPSILPDPFPNAVREAMILGKAVVGARDGGIVDLIRHEETGLLVEPGDAAALAGAVHDLLSQPEKAKQLGRNAERFAEQHLSVQTCQARFLSLLRDLARRRRTRT